MNIGVNIPICPRVQGLMPVVEFQKGVYHVCVCEMGVGLCEKEWCLAAAFPLSPPPEGAGGSRLATAGIPYFLCSTWLKPILSEGEWSLGPTLKNAQKNHPIVKFILISFRRSTTFGNRRCIDAPNDDLPPGLSTPATPPPPLPLLPSPTGARGRGPSSTTGPPVPPLSVPCAEHDGGGHRCCAV